MTTPLSEADDYDLIGSQFSDAGSSPFTGNFNDASADDALQLATSPPAKAPARKMLPSLVDPDAAWKIIANAQASPNAPPSDAVPSLNRSDETVSVDGVQSLRSQPTRQIEPEQKSTSPNFDETDLEIQGHTDTASPTPTLVRSPLSMCSSPSSTDDETMSDRGGLANANHITSFSHNNDSNEHGFNIGLSIIIDSETRDCLQCLSGVDGGAPTDSPGLDGDGEGSTAANTPKDSSSSNSVPKKRNVEEASHASKRQRREGDESGADSSHSNAPGAEHHKVEKHLACPFYKLDPNRHRRCYGHILTTPSRVKQHLFRAHTAPLYCPRCLDTFPDESSLNHHIRNDIPCRVNEGDPPSGLTEKDASRLRSRVGKHYKSDEEHWYWIFSLLFPDAPKPESPYIDHDVGEDVTSFVEFGRSNGSRIFRQGLEQEVLASGLQMEPEVLQTVGLCFDNVLKELFDNWKTERTTNNPGGNLPAPKPTISAKGIDLVDLPRRTDTGSTVQTDTTVGTAEWQPLDDPVTNMKSPDVHVGGKRRRKPLPTSSRSPVVFIAGDEDADSEGLADRHGKEAEFML